MNARNTLVVLSLALVALIAIACAPAFTPPADAVGTLKVGANEPIHLTWMFVVTGEDGTLGVDSRRGIEIAIDDKGGKLLDRAIKLDGQDSGCNAEGGQAAAAKLAADATVVGVIGSSCSSEMRAGGPALSKAGFTIISPSNTAPDLTDPAKRVAGYFRTAHNDTIQGAVAAQFVLTQLKLKNVATIHDGSPYAEGLANVFAANIEKGGGKVVAKEAVSPTDKEFKPVLTKIAAAKPEMLFYPIFISAGSLITKQAKEVPGVDKIPLMAADGTFSGDFYKGAGTAAVGMYQSSPDFSAFAAGYKTFLDKHQKKYNEKPLSAFHAHAYDAANVIFAAIEKVAVKGPDGALYIGRQALRDAVAATKDFNGITGKLTCDPNGDCGAPVIAVYQVTADNVSKATTPEKPFWAPPK
ncbi:MAG: branched-chain amino acid ABC transporter substrate-binding protein [Chloroflexi bacterium]|nr:branched-chain amino acid ABC transporter substrate-binding protein [Chloroflexota bacterium]